jgi:hypothetical protein
MAWLKRTNLMGPSPLRLDRLRAPLISSSATSWTTVFCTTIAARAVLSFQAELYCTGATTNTGLAASLSGPAGPAAVIVNLMAAESAISFRNVSVSAYDEPLISRGSGGSAIVRAQLSGTVENGSTAGNLLLRFRSEVAGSQITLVRGSWWQVLQH